MRPRPPTLRSELRRAAARERRRAAAPGRGVCRADSRAQVHAGVPLERVAPGRRRLAAHAAGRPTATSRGWAARRGSAAASARCSGRSSSRCDGDLEQQRQAHLAGDVRDALDRSARAASQGRRPSTSPSSTRPRTSARRAALPRGARRRSPERPLLRRRPRPAHLPGCRSPGSRSASTCAAGPTPCASTTGPRTRSAATPTGSCRQRDRGRRRQYRGLAAARISVFNGPEPEVYIVCNGRRRETVQSADWIRRALRDGLPAPRDRRLRAIRGAARPGQAALSAVPASSRRAADGSGA